MNSQIPIKAMRNAPKKPPGVVWCMSFSTMTAATIEMPRIMRKSITYNLIDFLIILGISIVAAVIVEKLMHQTTPGGFFGAFLIALIGIRSEERRVGKECRS